MSLHHSSLATCYGTRQIKRFSPQGKQTVFIQLKSLGSLLSADLASAVAVSCSDCLQVG